VRTYLDCIPCFLRQTLEAARAVTDDPRIQEQVVRDVLRLTADLDLGQSPPHVGQAIHRRLRELTGASDPYRAAKQQANRLAIEALPALAAIVSGSADPLLTAARLGIAANAIDMGVAAALTEAEIRAALLGSSAPLHGDGETLRRAAAEATEILFLADNAGEIAVDRLLIEQLGPRRVTLAVRGGPVLNDATIEDAREVGLTELVEVIENGSDAPGTILADCSPAFRERFDRAALVIAKGQGNYETLSGTAAEIVFLFKVKCPLVASEVGLPVGTHALFHQERGVSRR
jgi:uncharacterized protein with ATP-grasp and redox domains